MFRWKKSPKSLKLTNGKASSTDSKKSMRRQKPLKDQRRIRPLCLRVFKKTRETKRERERCRVSASSPDDRGGRIRWKRKRKKTNVASVPPTGKRVGKKRLCCKKKIEGSQGLLKERETWEGHQGRPSTSRRFNGEGGGKILVVVDTKVMQHLFYL